MFHGTVNYEVSATNISYWKCSSDDCSYMLYKQSEAAGDDDSSITLTIIPEKNKRISCIEILHSDGTRTIQTDTNITIQKEIFEDLEITVYSDYTEEYKKKKWVYFSFDNEHYTCNVNGTLVKPSARYYCEVGDTLNVSLNIIPAKADTAKPFGWWRNSKAHLSTTDQSKIFITDEENFSYNVTNDTPKGEVFTVMYLKTFYIEYDSNASVAVNSLFNKNVVERGVVKNKNNEDDATLNYYSMTTAMDSEVNIEYTSSKEFDCWCTIEYDNNGNKFFVPCLKYDGEYKKITNTTNKFLIDRTWNLYPKSK